MSAQELAAKVGSTQGTISRLETGTQAITMEWLEKLSYALGVKPSALIDDTMTYAALRGDLRSGRGEWPLFEGDDIELIPVPTLFDIHLSGRKVTAFRVDERALVFCDRGQGFSEAVVGKPYVLHIRVPGKGGGLCMAVFEDDMFGPGFVYTQGYAHAPRIGLWDECIHENWRVLTRYEAVCA